MKKINFFAFAIITLAMLATASLVAVRPAQAAVGATWNSSAAGGNTDWNTAGNWSGNGVPIATTSDAYFVGTTGLTTTANVATAISLNLLQFYSAASGYTISASSTGSIALQIGLAAQCVECHRDQYDHAHRSA